MAYQPQTFSVPKLFSSTVPYPSAPFVTPEMFGAIGNGTHDDTSAIQSCITACLTNGYQVIRGGGNYGVSGAITVPGFTNGISIHLGTVTILSGYPSPSTWLTATPVFDFIGGTINIDFSVLNVIDGSNRADVVSLTAGGVGISRFHIGQAYACNIPFKIPGVTNPSSSNYVTGNTWYSCTAGAYLSGGSSTCEGTMFDVNFIWSCKYPGIILNDGSQYTNIRGQLDFNGTFCSELHVASLTGWAIGQTVTDTTHTGKTGTVLATYTYQGSNVIFVIETKQTSGGNSNFTAGDTITNGTNTTTISSIRTAAQSGSNFYFDILSAYTSAAPFAKTNAFCSYLGGIVGSYLDSDVIFSQNSTGNFTNQMGGFGVTNSGTQLALYNFQISNNPFAVVTSNLTTWEQDFSVAGNGLFGTEEAGITASSGTPTTVSTLSPGDGNGSVWEYDVWAFNDGSINASGRVYISSGASSGTLVSLNASNCSITLSGLNIQVTQNLGSPRTFTSVVTNRSTTT